MAVTACLADPLAVRCDHCGAEPGQRCMTISWWAKKPHACRVKLALVLAAHSDPVLDEHFAQSGECGLCSTPGLGARHRVVDAIAGRLEAGEDAGEVARDYGQPVEAVEAVRLWAANWPGAWQ